MCRAEVSRAHVTLVASAIRLAECMNLHQDGVTLGLGAVETHVRRLIWYQLCFLDIRTYEAHAHRPIIRAEEFKTRFPLNMDDQDLERTRPPTEDANHWTEMTPTIIRFKCNELIRLVYSERLRIQDQEQEQDTLKKKAMKDSGATISTLLGKIGRARQRLNDTYLPMINNIVAIQFYGRLLLQIQTLRTHAMVLHNYHMSTEHRLPRQSFVPDISMKVAYHA